MEGMSNEMKDGLKLKLGDVTRVTPRNIQEVLLRETCCCAHHTFLLGFPTSSTSTLSHQAFFWRRCRGVKDIFTRGVPHNQSLYFVVFILLSFFLLCFLVLFFKNTKKLVLLVCFLIGKTQNN